MFRGKESSNRIELSQLVQELLNFGVLGSLWLWGWGVGFKGCMGWEVPPHMYTCTHALTHTCTEIANGCRHGGIHVYHVYHVYACVCMHVHVCVHGTPHPHPYPPPLPSTHLPPPRGEPMESVKIW